LANHVNLVSLELNNNQVSDLSPLASCVNIVQLGLRQNLQIIDISPLDSMPKLKDLQLWGNQIKDISPLMSLNNLKTLWIVHDNPLNDESLNKLVPQLRAKGIQVM
jgi:Leucine-rich repeat (LRR) protein